MAMTAAGKVNNAPGLEILSWVSQVSVLHLQVYVPRPHGGLHHPQQAVLVSEVESLPGNAWSRGTSESGRPVGRRR